ncbi:MAG TPA: sigma 54-interacting transcriptional regulator [Polyangiaceae bacterium]|nr:sigma 54-interacting transcriptional regulator [Polyangiaceae bacterium]
MFSMKSQQEKSLVFAVAAGVDVGREIVLVEGAMRRVGRAPDMDLVLHDPRVSRRHLEVTMAGGVLKVRALAGAQPFRHQGAFEQRAELPAGDEIVIGDTRLRVERGRPRALITSGPTPDEATLMDTKPHDAQGFAALFALSEALDGVESRDELALAVDSWARTHVPAAGAALVYGEAQEGGGGGGGARVRAAEVTERARPEGGVVLSVPALGPGGLRLTIELALSGRPAEVTDFLRRLLLLAARLCATAVGRLQALETVRQDNAALRSLALGSARVFLGQSPAAEKVAKLIPRLAASEASVLVEGETGTGKSFVARLIHEASVRAHEPFRALNCAAIPESLLEAELFGHEKGAFTGAVGARAGAFEAAGRGTLFLDEIGELPLGSQAKLLRALEERRFERLGSNRPLTLHARVLAATNRNLADMVRAGRFRGDLLYRLSVVKVTVPPLRERGEDLMLLAEHILSDLSAQAGRRVAGFSPEAVRAICRYDWPGNVRELRNAIEHALVLGDAPVIGQGDLPDLVRGSATLAAPQGDDPMVVRLPAELEWLEKRAIEAALRAAGGNVTRAAKTLGIGRTTLYRKLSDGSDGAAAEPGGGTDGGR